MYVEEQKYIIGQFRYQKQTWFDTRHFSLFNNSIHNENRATNDIEGRLWKQAEANICRQLVKEQILPLGCD